jgi:hypothetical protein
MSLDPSCQLEEQFREHDALSLLVQEIRLSVAEVQRAIFGLAATRIDLE